MKTKQLSPADDTLLLNFIHELKGFYPTKNVRLAKNVDHPSNLPLHVAHWVRHQMETSQQSFSAVICRQDQDAKALYDQLRQMGLASVKDFAKLAQSSFFQHSSWFS